MRLAIIIVSALISGCSLSPHTNSKVKVLTLSSIWSESSAAFSSIYSLQKNEKQQGLYIVIDSKKTLSLDTECGITRVEYSLSNNVIKGKNFTRHKKYSCRRQVNNGEKILIKSLKEGMLVHKDGRQLEFSNESTKLIFKSI